MRFGIMSLQIDKLLPPGGSSQSVFHTLRTFDHQEHIRQLALTGFNLFELGGDLELFIPDAFSPDAIDGLAAIKKELNLSYTVHLPLWSVEPSTPLGPVRRGSVQALISTIKATLPLDPETYILHATGSLAAEFYRMHLPDYIRTIIMKQFQGNAIASIRTILDDTGISPRKLAIETIEFPFELTTEIAELMDLSICLDVGHILVGFSGPVGLFDALEVSLPRLAEIHLHDGPWQGPELVPVYGKDHQALGKGDLEIAHLLDRLMEVRFTGPIIFELSIEQAMESLALIRKLRPGCVQTPPSPGDHL
jgi:sugar phosphate isomerase/epimerase